MHMCTLKDSDKKKNYIYVHMNTYTLAYTHLHTLIKRKHNVYIHIQMHIDTYTAIPTCTHIEITKSPKTLPLIHTCTQKYAHTWTHIHSHHMLIYINKKKISNTRTYVHVHIHTDTH